MVSNDNKEWKKKLGFPINYDSGQSSDEDVDIKDVVMRHPKRSSRYLLEESGDGSEADLLGTTPPRARIRDKEKRRNMMDSGMFFQRATIHESTTDVSSMQPTPPERLKKRASLKLTRSKERDWKQEFGQRETKADSMPSSGAPVPTLKVESCSRFMSLSSRLKCRPAEELVQERPDEELPASRVNFHNTFSMLINMGNIEKGCRRTISREEKVWQNELKDLIWLEIQAKIAGRSLAQQDAFLCAQRNIIPSIVQRILEYKFVSSKRCQSRDNLLTNKSSIEELVSEDTETLQTSDRKENSEIPPQVGCLNIDCVACSDAIGDAMCEVTAILDAFDRATALYPSTIAAGHDHPALASRALLDRLRAMCLWYNTALHMRLKLLSVRRMLHTVHMRQRRRNMQHKTSIDSRSSESSNPRRSCQVRFDVSNASSSNSNNSDTSAQSDNTDDKKSVESDQHDHKESSSDQNDHKESSSDQNDHKESSSDQNDHKESSSDLNDKLSENSDGKNNIVTNHDDKKDSEEHIENGLVQDCEDLKKEEDGNKNGDVEMGSLEEESEDVLDSGYRCDAVFSSDPTASNESGYSSGGEWEGARASALRVGELTDLTQLRLLARSQVSAYREYHYEVLKTAGVRRCMMFMNKICSTLLHKVYLTLLEPQEDSYNYDREDETPEERRQNDKNIYELRRFGCWSAESIEMCLPSYRNHFLLLNCICMEALHDYLSLRIDTRPEQPCCLTIKQLIHELKEGLDIAAETRASFARNVRAALRGWPADRATDAALARILHTYDATVATATQQYLSYMVTMSATEALPRSALAAECSFAARLAARAPPARHLVPPAFAKIACNQLDRLLKQYQEKFESLDRVKESAGTDEMRYEIYTLCREAQCIYSSSREAALQAAQWARVLGCRLPARYNHEKANIFDSLMALCTCLVDHTQRVLENSRAPAPVPYTPSAREIRDLNLRVRELLLQMYKLGFEMHKELHRFVADGRSGLGGRRPRVFRCDSIGEDVEGTAPEPGSRAGLAKNNLDWLLGLDRRADRLVPVEAEEPGGGGADGTGGADGVGGADGAEGEWAKRSARAVVQFARCWMAFVVERCDRGRGLRPRWASQGLEFLMLACDPYNTRHLTDEEFEELKQQMDGCISHVIGSRPAPHPAPHPPHPPPPHRHRHRLHSPVPSSPASKEAASPPSEPDTPPVFAAPEPLEYSKRVIAAVRQLDAARDRQLRQAGSVGRVLSAARPSYEPKLRQLTFKWQRGLKIGAGTFGKVYTVVNTESGQVLAMKELSIGAGDRRALQRAANELRVLEGVAHPHLVRYYGCELHREEMLLFMELCVEGSLEALIATSGALAEHTTRRYTKQLVSALAELHARAIAHRDIKSGNIFLTNEGHCLKLGDFGCAVKIRANTTAPGELQGFVGTQAYMAPEVFMKSSGHGRAADIWSLGCVVTEMAAGKRPFSEYDSNYQIMFVVGMGGRPAVPPALSREGRAFCLACLTHDPAARPAAEVLSLHHFLMVKSDDDCNCEPSFPLNVAPKEQNNDSYLSPDGTKGYFIPSYI